MASPAVASRVRSALLGAYVADAAALGLQWLYDPARIAELTRGGNGSLAFREPNAKDFENSMGYFIGTNKRAGDLSPYGEHFHVAVRAVGEESDRTWNTSRFLAIFQATFDRGGSYVGYIDNATRGTLNNLGTLSTKAVNEALAANNVTDDEAKHFCTNFLPKKALELRGEPFVKAVADTAESHYNDKAARELGENLAAYYDKNRPLRTGADDDQISGLAKLPAVVAAALGRKDFDAIVEEAVRSTNNNGECVAYGIFVARLLEAIVGDKALAVDAAVDEALKLSPDQHGLHEAVKRGRAFDARAKGASGLSQEFSRGSCPVKNTVPLLISILSAKDISYPEAIRLNVAAGGDSCGRAVVLGAALGGAKGLGTVNGVPLSWIGKLTKANEATAAIDAATAANAAL